jgi:hypothetical protein
MLTKETPETFHIGKLIQATVTGITHRFAFSAEIFASVISFSTKLQEASGGSARPSQSGEERRNRSVAVSVLFEK